MSDALNHINAARKLLQEAFDDWATLSLSQIQDRVIVALHLLNRAVVVLDREADKPSVTRESPT